MQGIAIAIVAVGNLHQTAAMDLCDRRYFFTTL
jgi:hypothetical protein